MEREKDNKVLLLKIIDLAKHIHRQRLVYISFILQVEGRRVHKTTLNYRFAKWHIEPHCIELLKDLEQLILEGYVRSDDTLFLTSKGQDLLEQHYRHLNVASLNQFILYYINLYNDSPLHEIVNLIHIKYRVIDFKSGDVISHVEEPKEKFETRESISDGKKKDEIVQENTDYLLKLESFLKSKIYKQKNAN